jgi:hypothetical protein
MEGALVVMREQRERLRLKNRYFVVFPGELANVIERVESREDDECSLVALVSAQDIRAAEPGNASHRREQFAQEELLVRVSVLCCRPPSPQARDHNGSSTVPRTTVLRAPLGSDGPCWDRTSDLGIKSGCRCSRAVSGMLVMARG